MRVAIVVDHLEEEGGVERWVKAMVTLWPHATLFTPFVSPRAHRTWQRYPVYQSVLSLPVRVGIPKWLTVPLLPFVVASFDFTGFDVVLSSHAWFATSILVPPGVPHVCYCHTPPRFLWGYETERKLKRGALILPFLRLHDYFAAQRVTCFVTNSQNVARRIKKFYRREALVVPCAYDVMGGEKNKEGNIENNGKSGLHTAYFLVVSRLVAYKNVELAVKVCTALGLWLVVVGDGPERKRLERIAGATVTFLGFVDDATLVNLYAHCTAVIFPADDDFGNVPVEAMQAGRPVIALGKGGALETVLSGKTGEFFREPTADSLRAVLRNFDHKKYAPVVCRTQGRRFSRAVFLRSMRRIVEEAVTMAA